ncbi:MAG: hypothetical protein ACI93H_000022, partial [Psychromonas sp.]
SPQSRYEANFIPTIPATINPKLISFKTLKSSPKSNILAIAVPTVPIATQTPSARLKGNILNDQPKAHKHSPLTHSPTALIDF